MPDLRAYLDRIGFEGVPRPDMATLRQVALRHPMAITFENLDAFLGRRVSLEPVDVERKLLRDGRGGWCFEHNLLLGAALREIGFDVTDLAGRVVLGREADAVAARTHRLLLVRAAGGEWIADAGFGGLTLTDVLDLHAEGAQQTPHGRFRLRALGNERVLEAQVGEGWLPMFRFDLHPQQPIDFEAANFQLVHDPASHFTQSLRISLIAPDGRHTMRGRELAFHPLAGETRRRTLNDAEVLDALRSQFGLSLAGLGDLPARVSRLPRE